MELLSELESLTKVASEIIGFSDCKVFVFHGEMGAGKTTLIKELCSHLGVSEGMSSPTFSIVNEYLGGRGEPVYHFDFYRINDVSEALDIGAEDYFFSGNYCFIEWPDRVVELLPNDFVEININLVDEIRRMLSITLHGPKN
ncbi:MAG: tRNA (adenosine(37)-N6)-threonylcarbamoyltransferase complex ATPase subunit type 1 TsaE [Cyclobacteriaceae bacterium]|nr:tRNA (adenosine(37)-N6)-threonylcarbamoyltransferase complex ATPase subunit type 1 TsaE [Cyclobacteriaceae bacterium HetDA_MAG_MS6]